MRKMRGQSVAYNVMTWKMQTCYLPLIVNDGDG